MRTLVDIPKRQIDDLAMICQVKNVSRAEVIRQAITAFINLNKPSQQEAFGIWKSHGIDGLDYQEKMRSEW